MSQDQDNQDRKVRSLKRLRLNQPGRKFLFRFLIYVLTKL